VRGRLWLKHEGYVYLAAMFCVNVGVLLFCASSFWMMSSEELAHYYPPHASTFMCKVWFFLTNICYASGWLCVALLFNVYLREHLIHRRRCGCPIFAAKYCTLFASKIIVGVVLSLLFVLCVPYLVIMELQPEGYCDSSEPTAYRIALLVREIVMLGLPYVFFLPIILVTTLCTKREVNTFAFSQIEERSASDEQMRVVAATLSSMNLFSHCVLIVLVYGFSSALYENEIIRVLVYLSVGLQPILCFVILKALRDGFRSQLRNIRCCRRLFSSLTQEREAVQLREVAVQLRTIQEDPPNTTES